ncbi:AcrR family transcriptional regulator [Paenibacillus methanolicus]|uniref:AcrR family transcriptional regulator n=2 Tax=Paenibacillus methanolicus TaxID=582686 RepID=A0A5S5C627_9BACL|nr:AcrR family transcriptional regulator [Paenibacillus methanolicus]
MAAAIELMANRGFKGVSTKEIAAAAGVSEMTLFRQFGSKKNLLDQAVDRHHYSAEMELFFREDIVWDLAQDLHQISRLYHDIMNRNRHLFLIVLKDDELTDIRERAQQHPRKLLELLTGYLADMRERQAVIEMDVQAQAMAFMWMNYGAFMAGLFVASPIADRGAEAVIAGGVETFARAWAASN